MGSLADALALFAPLALTAMFVAAFFDEVDPQWAARGLVQRVRAMPALAAVLALLWLLALLGVTGWPATLVHWIAGWSFQAVATLVGWLGLAAALAGLGLAVVKGLGARGAGLRAHVIACQLPYALLVGGVGAAQAGLGSH
jgi:hypothetical protein